MAPETEEPAERGTGRRRRRRRRQPATSTTASSARGARRQAAPTSGGGVRGADAPASAAGAVAARSTASGRSGGAGRKRAATKKTATKKATGRAARRTKTVTEVSAGGVVYRRAEGDVEMLMAARRTRRGALAWGLAKGGIEDGESIERAAVREVLEETGIRAEIEEPLGDTRYTYVWENVRIRKTVHFFLMRAVGGDPADHDDEMEDVRWFPLERAIKRAAYRGEREKLQRAADLLR